MRLDPATLEKLMAYADGELDGPDRTKIEALILVDKDAARIAGELGALSDCVRVIGDRRDLSPADGIADAVMARIETEKKDAPTPRISAAPPGEPGAQVIDLAARRKRNIGLTVAGLVAAAAAFVVFAREPQPQTSAQATPTTPVAVPVEAPKASATVVVAAASTAPSVEPGVQVDQVDKSSHVFLVPGTDKAAPSVVIWLGEESAGGTK